MTPYKLYNIFRAKKGWSKVTYDNFENSTSFKFCNMLCDRLVQDYKLSDEEIKDFITVAYDFDPHSFEIFELMSEKYYDAYQKWKTTSSTKALYFKQVMDGFAFIENFCLKNNIDFQTYRAKYSMKHVREEKYDQAVSVFLKLIDIASLNTVEKMLLKKYINKYDIVTNRIDTNKELRDVLSNRKLLMIEVIKSNKSKENKV